MTDIVRLVRLDHGIVRRQFADLYQARPCGEPGRVDAAWAPLVALLLDHDAATRRLVDSGAVDIDPGRRSTIATASDALRQAIATTRTARAGSDAWFETVYALHRVYRHEVVSSDEALVELLRIALDDDARHQVGQQWLDRHQLDDARPAD